MSRPTQAPFRGVLAGAAALGAIAIAAVLGLAGPAAREPAGRDGVHDVAERDVAERGDPSGEPHRDGAPPRSPAPSRARFDAQRAFTDLRDQVALGPRPAGSPAAARTRELIRERMVQAGWVVEAHDFEARPPGAPPIAMTNLIATRRGRRPGVILLGAHYDTKAIPGVHFVGANDGASGVALLLELARALGPEPGELTLRMVFFDGEEAAGPTITGEDGLFGSTALAERMERDGTLQNVRALLLFDMIADRDLNLAVDLNSSPALRALLEEKARALVDPSHRLYLTDDHMPFRRRGLDEVLALIDFQYGARTSPGPRWHTAADDLTGVSAQSLNAVGAVALELVAALEATVAP
jgi:hypothetical protein